MTRQELAALPKGTKLFVISRKVSRSGMRQVFDVFYLEAQTQFAIGSPFSASAEYLREIRPLWIRLSGPERTDFNKRFGVHACGSVDEDRRVGGSYYVNGCGFSRTDELVCDLSRWATGDDKHFTCEVL